MNYNELFAQRFAKLNEGQKSAVNQTEGPVMVIAGPGTGKTEVLGARIANILKKNMDINAANILCLTYTKAGVVAMRKRLLSFIGTEAHKVEIHTFHSFCNQIIQENPEIFRVKSLENISELEKYEFTENLLNNLDPKNPLFSRTSHYYLRPLLSLFSMMKSENWTVEFINKQIDLHIENCKTSDDFVYKRKYKEFKKGDINQKKLDTEIDKVNKLRAGISLFKNYQDFLNTKGLYDFDDMILWILEKFKTDDAFLGHYQEQFQYILVDEFQDTNGSQKSLIDLLISYWKNPNVFIVGDDDQSIFRFQGANLRNILDFHSQHQDNIKIVTIDKNYRSSQNILTVAQKIIQKNSERLVAEIPNLQKELSAENLNYKDLPIAPQLTAYHNEIHQELGILKALIQAKHNNENLAEIAIIYKNHAQVKNLIKLCEEYKIPINVNRSQNTLEIKFIQQVLKMLEYFIAEQEQPFEQEHLLFEILHYPFFALPKLDILKLMLALREAKSAQRSPSNKLHETLNSAEISEQSTLKTLMVNEGLLARLNLSNTNDIIRVGNLFLDLEAELINTTPQSFLEKMLQESGIFQWIIADSDSTFFLRALQTLFDFLKSETQKDPKLLLVDWIKKIKLMKHHELTLPVTKIIHEAAGINFVTAHSSKGLEFEKVFILGVDKKTWDKKTQNRGFFYPNTLTRSNDGDFFEENRRLFFVALTRAKKHLEISYSSHDQNNKELDESLFVTELSSLDIVNQSVVTFEDEEISKYLQSLMTPLTLPPKTLIDKDSLRPLLDNYRLSATHLNKYLECPRAFYFENFLRVPSGKNAFSGFGSAIHNALEQYFLTSKSRGKVLDLSVLLNIFEESIQQERSSFTTEEFSKNKKHGLHALTAYYKQYSANFKLDILLEKSIKTNLDHVPLSGKIDKIEFVDAHHAQVIDYKTGKYSNAKDKLQKPAEKNDFIGGDYWRQIAFYKILIDNDPLLNWQMNAGIMDFVEAEKGTFNTSKIVISEQDQQLVESQIKDTYAKITNFEFEHGCGKSDCKWCNFVNDMAS